MPVSLLSEPPLVVDEDSVLGCIKSFPKGTSCGRDGLRVQHILDAFCGEGSTIAVGLLKSITAMPSRLYLGDDHIWSTTGVQQGDPLGPLFFALNLHPLVHLVQDSCKLLFNVWYLDDGTIIGDTKEVAKALDIIRVEGPRLGLELNIKKTEVFWPSCNGVKVQEGMFPRVIGRPMLGVKLLGGAVSRDAEFISELAVKRASRAVVLMSHLPHLQDPQCELLLLRSCMGVGKLLFGLRTCQPEYVGEVVSVFDNGLWGAVEDIVSSEVKFDLSPRQKALFECLRSPRAQDFLSVIPIEGLGQHMSALEYRTILKYRLMIPLFPVDEPCPVCHKVYEFL
ncbi:uncharacterized protein LOC143535209 [Bidens hawaiensis]|uniref:uncharacterized protein LOC143535209 n=1 Tax=Bidens hawaiensis TaxID=980011 RepID=UPI004049B996